MEGEDELGGEDGLSDEESEGETGDEEEENGVGLDYLNTSEALKVARCQEYNAKDAV